MQLVRTSTKYHSANCVNILFEFLPKCKEFQNKWWATEKGSLTIVEGFAESNIYIRIYISLCMLLFETTQVPCIFTENARLFSTISLKLRCPANFKTVYILDNPGGFRRCLRSLIDTHFLED